MAKGEGHIQKPRGKKVPGLYWGPIRWCVKRSRWRRGEALVAGQEQGMRAHVQCPGPVLCPTANEESLDIFK